MKTLEQEAEYYAQYSEEIADRIARAYRAGANSKWVQAEKIKAQIELMKELYENSYIKSGSEFWKKKFTELEQQLKQLEDEKDTIQT